MRKSNHTAKERGSLSLVNSQSGLRKTTIWVGTGGIEGLHRNADCSLLRDDEQIPHWAVLAWSTYIHHTPPAWKDQLLPGALGTALKAASKKSADHSVDRTNWARSQARQCTLEVGLCPCPSVVVRKALPTSVWLET